MSRSKVTAAIVFVVIILLIYACGPESLKFSKAPVGATMQAGLGYNPLGQIDTNKEVFGPPAPLSLKDLRKVRARKKIAKLVSNAPMMTLHKAEVKTFDEPKDFTISAGFDLSHRQLLPVLRIRFGVSTQVVIGINGTYIEGRLRGADAEVFGGGVSIAYYFSAPRFEGFSWQTGLNYYDISSSTATRTSNATPAVVWSGLGWEALLGKNWNFGAALGAQYVANGGKDTGAIDFDGLLPLLKLAIGYSF